MLNALYQIQTYSNDQTDWTVSRKTTTTDPSINIQPQFQQRKLPETHQTIEEVGSDGEIDSSDDDSSSYDDKAEGAQMDS